MKISRIELEGFQGFRDHADLDIENVSLAAVVGPNRAGKSSLIYDAVLFALFGKSRSTSIKDITTRGSRTTTVRLTFNVQGHTYRVTRIRGSRNEVVIERQEPQGFVPLSHDKHGDADAQIRELLGMDYSMSTLTWAIGQGESGRFAMADPAVRRKELAKAFGLSEYTEWHKKAKAQAAECAGNIRQSDGQLNQVRQNIASLEAALSSQEDRASLDARIESLRAQHERAIAMAGLSPQAAQHEKTTLMNAHHSAMSMYESAIRSAQSLVQEYEHAQHEQSLLSAEFGDEQTVIQRCENGQNVLAALRSQREKATSDIALSTSQLNEAQQRYDMLTSLSDSTCPTCTRKVSAKLARELGEMEVQRMSELNEKLSAAQTEMAQITQQGQVAEARLGELQGVVRRHEQARLTLQQREGSINDARETLNQQPPTLDEERIRQLDQVIAGQSVQASQIQAELENALNARSQADHNAQALEEARQTETGLAAVRAQKVLRQEAFEKVAEAFHESGIPTMILVGIVNELNVRSAHLLQQMGGDDLGIEVTLETGKLMVRAIQGDYRVDYTTLSGSEKFRVDLALRLAIMQAITTRQGRGGVETIILDEGWGMLDDATKQSIITALRSLSHTFDIYTVSHIADVKDAFTMQIEVTNEQGSSRVRPLLNLENA